MSNPLDELAPELGVAATAHPPGPADYVAVARRRPARPILPPRRDHVAEAEPVWAAVHTDTPDDVWL